MAFHVAEFHGPNALAISPATHQFRQFRSRKYQSHDDKLDRKVSAIQHNTDAALRLLGPLGDGYATAIAVGCGSAGVRLSWPACAVWHEMHV
jgi:hypothetical protein